MLKSLNQMKKNINVGEIRFLIKYPVRRIVREKLILKLLKFKRDCKEKELFDFYVNLLKQINFHNKAVCYMRAK